MLLNTVPDSLFNFTAKLKLLLVFVSKFFKHFVGEEKIGRYEPLHSTSTAQSSSFLLFFSLICQWVVVY